MDELSDLFKECLIRYNNCGPCDSNTCKLGFFCTANSCEKGRCDKCINHIQRSTLPSFHYSCVKITYHYILRFFNRFASEITYNIASWRKDYFQGRVKLNVLSLGCGAGSEVYGIIKALNYIAPHVVLDYKGFDLNGIWNDVQQISKNTLSRTKHHVEFHNLNMFGAFEGFPTDEVDILVLNYLLSDSQKYYNDEGKTKFIEDIAQFVIEHNVQNLLFNDNGYYGKGGLDSGVGMMLHLIKTLKEFQVNPTFEFRCFPSDKYIPSLSWKQYEHEHLLFQPLPNNTFDTNITCCRSKQILVHINK